MRRPPRTILYPMKNCDTNERVMDRPDFSVSALWRTRDAARYVWILDNPAQEPRAISSSGRIPEKRETVTRPRRSCKLRAQFHAGLNSATTFLSASALPQYSSLSFIERSADLIRGVSNPADLPTISSTLSLNRDQRGVRPERFRGAKSSPDISPFT